MTQSNSNPPRLDRDAEPLSAADTRFVERIRESLPAPERSVADRVAFQRKLDESIAKRGSRSFELRWEQALGGLAVAGILGAVIWSGLAGLGLNSSGADAAPERVPPIAERRETPQPASEGGAPSLAFENQGTAAADMDEELVASSFDAMPEESLLSLSDELSESLNAEDLPDDYDAIASLFLGDA